MSPPRAQSSADARWLFTIDLLRGIAATAVVLFHAHLLFWRSPIDNIFEGRAHEFFHTRSLAEIVSYLLVTGFGFLGVPLFFVISGFCIHLPLAGSNTPLKIGPYAVRRFFRLYPLYFAVVCGAMLLEYLKRGPGGTVTVPNFLGHLVFWYYNVPKGTGVMGISMVLWSIAVEVHFYILYALLLPVIRRIGFGRSVLILLAFGTVYNIVWAQLAGEGGEFSPLLPLRFAPARFGEWLLGAWIAERWVRGTLPAPRADSSPGLGLVLAGFGIVCASIATVTALAVDRMWMKMPCSIGFAIVLMGLLVRERAKGPPARTLWVRLASWAGDRSYSLYLVHLTVLTVAVEVVSRVMHQPDKSALGGTLPMLVGILAGLVAVFIVTDLTYRLIEKPSHRLARELGRRASGRPAAPQSAPAPNPAP